MNILLAFCCCMLVQVGDLLMCPTISPNLVVYKKLPREGDTLSGSCLPNAVVPPYSPKKLSIICMENGNYTLQGECVCKEGFFKNVTRCHGCREGTTKPTIGNNKCIQHGRNTIGCDQLTAVCPCKEKFFRLTEEKNTTGSHCYETGKVRSLRYSNHTDGSVIITWRAPFKKSGYQTLYMVSLNNGTYRKQTEEKLTFPATNHTRHYRIKIITEVDVDGKVYRGQEFFSSFFVHGHIENSANQLSHQSVLLLLATFIMLMLIR